MTNTDFQTALQSFINHIESLGLGYDHPAIKPDTVGHSTGPKYIRVFKCYHGDTSQRSAYAFIRRSDGAILKPDGWKRPARHSRGSIFDPKTWTAVSRYGVAYLR